MSQWRIVKLGGGKCKSVPILGKCKSGNVAHGTDCPEKVRDAPGATRCLRHRFEEVEGCAGHDKRDCRKCPPRRV